MCTRAGNRLAAAFVLLLTAIASTGTPPVYADPITFSGSVAYDGLYSGDTLYVAVLDTVGVEDVTLLDVQAIAVSPPPFDQAYMLNFDNTGVAATVLIASFLDVDGGGLDDISGEDVFGWYAGTATPAAVSSAASQSGLDFALPQAEIQGDVTFAAGQVEARVDVSTDLTCMMEGFRPGTFLFTSGAYTVIGVYAGTYCVSADGFTRAGSIQVCYGDPTCASPTPVTVTAMEVRTGIDLDFAAASPIESSTWGRVKATYK